MQVHLIGCGPGDPELLTLKAARLIPTCDAVVYDDLIPAAALELARADAERYYVGKRAGRDYKPAYDKFTQAMQLMGPAVWNIGVMKYAATLQMGMPQSFQRFPNPDPSAAQMAAIREAVAKIKALG